MRCCSATTRHRPAVPWEGEGMLGAAPASRGLQDAEASPYECPFVDLPNPKSSRWGGGVTAGEMREMQWVKRSWWRRFGLWGGRLRVV